MRRLGVVGMLLALVACGDGTSSDGPDDEVIDRMRLTDVALVTSASYDVPSHWAAYNGAGRELPLADSLGQYIDRGLRWGVDSVPAHTLPVTSRAIPLDSAFVGRLYLFAPTARAQVELMGFHVLMVAR